MNVIPSSGLSGISGSASTPYGIDGAQSSVDIGSDSHAAGTLVASSVAQSSSITTNTVTATNSSSSLSLNNGPNDNKLGVLVMMLIELLLGLNKDGGKDKKDPLAGLAGLLLMSSQSRLGSSRFNYSQSQSSQVTQSTTVQSASAVQSVAFTAASGGATGGAPSLGGQLDVAG